MSETNNIPDNNQEIEEEQESISNNTDDDLQEDSQEDSKLSNVSEDNNITDRNKDGIDDNFQYLRKQNLSEKEQKFFDDINKPLSELDGTKEERDKFNKEKVIKNKKPKLYNDNIGTLLVKTKDVYYSIFDEISKQGIDYPKFTVFTKNNRLYYIGLGLIILVLILMLVNTLSFNNNKQSSQQFIIKLEKA